MRELASEVQMGCSRCLEGKEEEGAAEAAEGEELFEFELELAAAPTPSRAAAASPAFHQLAAYTSASPFPSSARSRTRRWTSGPLRSSAPEGRPDEEEFCPVSFSFSFSSVAAFSLLSSPSSSLPVPLPAIMMGPISSRSTATAFPVRICRCLVTDPSESKRTFHEGGRAAKASGEGEGSRASASEPDQAAGVESGCQFGHEGPPPPEVFFAFVVAFGGIFLESKVDGEGGAAAAARREEEEEEARPRGRLPEEEVVEVGDVDGEIGACDSLPSAGAARERRALLLLSDRDNDAAGVTPRQQREQARPPSGGEGPAIRTKKECEFVEEAIEVFTNNSLQLPEALFFSSHALSSLRFPPSAMPTLNIITNGKH